MIDPYVPRRGNAGYVVEHHDLDLDLSPASNRLDGRARLRVVPSDDGHELVFDLVHLTVRGVTVGGRGARWHQRDGKLHVQPATVLPAGRPVEVDIRYGGNPRPAPSRWGPLGWEELTDGVLVASQPTGAATWFPCNDVASQKATFTCTFTAPSAYRVIGNGRCTGHRRRGSTTTWRFEQPEPTSCYLVSLHLGRYDERVVAEGPVPIRLVAPPLRWPEVEVAFARLPEMVEVFVDRFGPYPFAGGYTVVVCDDDLDVPVEAQGQAAFGRNHLDHTYERLVAHELSHQWFGNSVTAARWRDIWLHEGFACYAEWLWSELSGGPDARAHARQHHTRLRSLPQDLLLADPGPDRMFDDRVYKRGALAVHALRAWMGDGAFFDLLRSWTSTHRYGVVATEDLIALAGAPSAAVLHPWLHQEALPALP